MVEACAIPMDGTKYGVDNVYEPNQLAALNDELTNSNATVADPLTQISIKVALSTLLTEEVCPFSYVTAYIELASQPSSRHTNQLMSIYHWPSENVWFMKEVCF
ncbi:unnamed protein product [Dibothriocephalus latus]|uniref:Uncharacterized protein n=1 Tax=Dibothriocephalus latus TaxID=60516 RepID=A0A3P6Q065_DIBLA|nr:unnamed protein product [Dibothriocephalus latus]